MNYTEEEFFGESQVTNQQGESGQNKVDVGGTIFSTFLKTLLVIVVGTFYIITICVGLFPNSAIKIFEAVNASKPALVCYERVYQKSETLADLYNLVQKSIEAKDYKRTNKYIVELQNKSGYNDFCFNVNEAAYEVTEDKYIAYVGDLDGYLVSQNILALYESGKKTEARNAAVNDLENENIYSFGLSTYIECVLSDDSLSEEDKNTEVIDVFYSKLNEESESYINELIEEKLDGLAYEESAELPKVEKILRVYTKLKIVNTKLKVYESANDQIAAGDARAEIEVLQNKYNDLIG